MTLQDRFQGPKLPILFLLYCDNKRPISGAIRLQKLVFILATEQKVTKRSFSGLNYIAKDFGMYSKEVQDDLVFLSNYGLIQTDNDSDFDLDSLLKEPEQHRPRTYSLTPTGTKFVEDAIKRISAEDREKLQKIIEACEHVKKTFNNMHLKDLLKYVYTKYPELTVNSKIKSEILGEEL